MGLRNWNTGRLFAEWRNVYSGELIPGKANIILPVRLTNSADDAIIPAGKLLSNVSLNITENQATADGISLDVLIPGTDDPDIVERGWGWTVEVEFTGGFAKETYYNVQVPVGGETNLRDLIPTTTAARTPATSPNLALFPRLVDGKLVDAQGNVIAGTGINIRGEYATEAALVAAHPTGAPGDGYIIGTDLWVWTDAGWSNAGPFQGPPGAPGETPLAVAPDGTPYLTAEA